MSAVSTMHDNHCSICLEKFSAVSIAVIRTENFKKEEIAAGVAPIKSGH